MQKVRRTTQKLLFGKWEITFVGHMATEQTEALSSP